MRWPITCLILLLAASACGGASRAEPAEPPATAQTQRPSLPPVEVPPPENATERERAPRQEEGQGDPWQEADRPALSPLAPALRAARDTLPAPSGRLVSEVRRRMQKYAPTPMPADLGGFTERQQALLKALLKASALADEIFWRQTGRIALPMRGQVEAAYAEGHPVRVFYHMQAGPYDRLDHDAAFLDVPPKPPGAGFYPPDMTAEEFQAWIDAHPDDRAAFLDPYTVIRRRGDSLIAIPYHVEYADLVEPLAEALRDAATYADNGSFRRFLQLKAEAVRTDEYFAADTAWIAMEDPTFDIVIGPFEVYEDQLLNLKAAYEASVEIVDQEASADLAVYTRYLEELEAALPYPDSLKPESGGLTANFTIVRDIYRGGQIRTGYQPVAANLPNDPRVHTEVGTKKTFWKNMMDARFSRIIQPISARLIVPEQLPGLNPDAYFNFVLMHELAHGLGPRFATTSAGRVPVNQALRDLYSWIEENKADIAGLVALEWLMESGIIDPATREDHLVSYLGSLFRTIRFGTAEAHGLAAMVSLNWYLEHGGITAAGDRYRVNPEDIGESIRSLARELLMIEVTGDYERAVRLREEYGTLPEPLRAALESASDIPVDVVPVYVNRW